MMKNQKRSFASKLSFKTVLLTSLLFLATVVVILYKEGHTMYDNAVKYSGQCLKTSILDVQTSLSEIEATSTAIATTFEEYYNDNQVIDSSSCYALLERTLKSNSSIIGCGFFFEPGRYIKGNRFAGLYATTALNGGNGEISLEWDDDASFAEDGYNYFEMEWYSEPREAGGPIWISPFLEYIVDTEHQGLMTTYSHPLKNNKGEFIGVFAIDMSLGWLYDKLVDIRPYEHSNVILADEDLNFICNPVSDTPYEGTMFDTPFVQNMDYTLERSMTRANLSDFGENAGGLRVTGSGNRAFLLFQEMDNGWILCTASLYSDIFADLNSLMLFIAILTVVTLILLYLLNRRVIYRIADPIRQFAGAANEITATNSFDVPIPKVDTGDELSDLSEAMTFMEKSIKNYIDELTSTTAEKERLKSELNVARDIQSKMLTTEFPAMKNAEFFATSIPAKEVGGDLYDFMVDGKYLYFIVGDVSGKGVPAALMMAICISAFRAIDKTKQSVAELVSLVNNTFSRSNKEMMFITLVAGRIDTETGEVEFCNAGHNPMMVVGSDGTTCYVKAKNNLVCGIMEDFPFESDSLQLGKGSRLLIYTDGITEAERADKAQYGEPKLLEWGNGCKTGTSSKEAVEDLLNSVNNFTEGNDPNDDRTMMLISLK